MNVIKSLKQRRISFRQFLVIGAITVALGLIAGLVNAQRPEQHPRFQFADGEKAFCADRGRMDVGHIDFEENPADGFTTPEDAINAYVSRLHLIASGELLEGAVLPDGLLELLEPSRRFQVTEKHDIDGNLTYFDLPSTKPGILEARIVVERIGEGFHVTQTFICEAQLVSNPTELERLWAEEMRKHERQ